MLKHASAWMKFALMIPLFLVTGCANVASNNAICDGTLRDRAAHAAALAEDGGDQSITTGVALIRKLDAACGDI